jgi:hypothetical protein
VRPTDENQHGSTRPNLMSPSRPGGGEDNILAMLERDAGRGRSSQFSAHPRMAWYAGAGALVVAMVGALGWLAWENATKERELPLDATHVIAVADTQHAAPRPLPSAPLIASAEAPHPVTAPAAAASVEPDPPALQTAGAAIIDSPPGPIEAPPPQLAQAPTEAASVPGAPPLQLAQATAATASVAAATAQAADPSDVPPLVLLPPAEATPKRAAAAPAPPPARPEPAAAVPAKAAAAKADAAPSSRQAAKADASPARRSAAKAPPRRPARPVLARVKKASGPATPAAQAKQADASADTDVALISAIIMHSSKHSAERAKAEAAQSCDGATCPAKPAAKRVTRRQKTTEAPPGA